MAAPSPQQMVYLQPQKPNTTVTVLKVLIGLGILGGGYFVLGKVAQKQGWNLGCNTGQCGVPLICAPCAGGGGGGGGGGGKSGPPAYGVMDAKTDFTGFNINDYVVQPSENGTFGGCNCCGTAKVCRGALTVTGTIYDSNNVPVPNQLLSVLAQGTSISAPAGFTVPSSIRTDANGKFSITIHADANSDPPTSCCGQEYSTDGPYPSGSIVIGTGQMAIPLSQDIGVRYFRYEPNLTGNCPTDPSRPPWSNCDIAALASSGNW